MMRKLIKTGVALLSALGMLCTGVFAASPTVVYDYSKNRVNISGYTNGDRVVLYVLKKNKTLTDLKNTAEDAVNFLYAKQLDSGAVVDGKFTFNIRYADVDNENFEAGEYNAYLLEDSGEITELKLDLFAKGGYTESIKKLNKAASNGDEVNFKDVMESNHVLLGYNFDLYKMINQDDALESCMNYISIKQLNSENSIENKNIISRFFIMQALTENKITNIDEYIVDSLDINGKLYKDYKKYTSDTKGIADEKKQKYLTDKLCDAIDKDYEFDDYATVLEQGIVLTTIRYADGFDSVKEVLNSYGDSVGITKSASDSVYRALCGKDYSAEEVKEAFEKSHEDDKTTDRHSGGSGGGSYGSGKSGAQYKIEETTEDISNEVKVYFNDIDGVDWANEAIIALADKGIINGKADGIFKPDDFVTREEFVKILVCAIGFENFQYSGNVFTDVNNTDWFCSYINIAYENKIIKGIGDGRFGTGEYVSRQDMAVMIYNAIAMAGNTYTKGELAFGDSELIADYAKDAVAVLYEIGAVNGVSEAEFDPLGNATRAQAAKIVYGVLEQLQ